MRAEAAQMKECKQVSWQKRDGKLYYYRSLRLNGRVRCWYFGTGPAADLADVETQLYQLDRLEAKERRQAALDRQQAVDAALGRLVEVSGLLARAALLAAGFHQHDRGAWRRRRVPKSHTRAG
jgi:hypothetical protein